MSLLEKAIAIALRAHQDQVDRSGQPYILHPLQLMLQMESDTERMVAVLHDVVEDTDVTFADLEEEGFPPKVLQAVRLLTHDEPDNPYEAYVRALKEDPIARKVKLADLQHNMDIRRLERVTQKDLERLQRYRQAWETLRN